MPKLTVITRAGARIDMDGPSGNSVMETIRDHGVDELLALCGGSCACATCHVYIDPGFTGTLPPIGEDEDMLLDSSDHRDAARSRLSCQLPFTDALDGLCVTIAPED